jgi:hypothetical protein
MAAGRCDRAVTSPRRYTRLAWAVLIDWLLLVAEMKIWILPIALARFTGLILGQVSRLT